MEYFKNRGPNEKITRILYRTKQCRTKVTKIVIDENLVQESLHLQAVLLDKSDEI